LKSDVKLNDAWVQFFFKQAEAYCLFQSGVPATSVFFRAHVKMFLDRLLLLQLSCYEKLKVREAGVLSHTGSVTLLGFSW
jgi:hypothetical protein